jgi:hypothetical protein
MKSRYLSLIAVAAIGLAVYLFWNGPHRVSGSGQNIVVLCSSCSVEGVPNGGIFLMDANTGDVWIYTDAAFEGKVNPIHWGKLTLGQPIARLDRQTLK